MINGKLEKIVIPFEKLEKLLFDKVHRHAKPENISKILSRVIIQAVGSDNPSKVVQDNFASSNRMY